MWHIWGKISLNGNMDEKARYAQDVRRINAQGRLDNDEAYRDKGRGIGVGL